MERVLITGANRGIGFALVEEYVKADDIKIFATCRNPDSATELNTLADQYPDKISVVQLDINDKASIDTSVKVIESETDALDVLINNAGINPKGQPEANRLGEMTAEAVGHIVTTNSVSPLIVSQAYRQLLQNGNNPRLVMVSSQMGSLARGGSGSYAYRMSKASMNMAAVTLSQDGAMSGITVVTTHPGWVQTDMGGANASITPTESATGMKRLIDGLTSSDNGKFYRWDGSEHAW